MRSKLYFIVAIAMTLVLVLGACTTVANEPIKYWTKELRQAIAATIDREAIVDRVFEGRNIPAYSSIPEGFASFKPSFLDKYGNQNLDMARELLTQAGYSKTNKMVMDLWYPPDHYGVETVDVMQVVKEQIESTDMVKVNFQSQNWAEYVDSFVAGELPFFILGWFPDYVHEDTWTSPWADCEQSKGNGVFYCNEEMQGLLEAARESTDAEEQIDLYGQIQDLFAEEVPIIPLFWEPEFITYRDGVEGVTIGAPFEFNYNVLSFADGFTPASGDMDTIIIGTTDEVNSLDPQDAYSTHDREILKNTGRPLLGYTPGTAELIPGTAESYEVSDDGLTYTFHLFEGIKYADGTPFTASEYVDMYDRWGLGGQVGFLPLTYINSVEAPDDLTVVFKLSGAYGFFPAIVAIPPFIPPTDEIPQDTITQYVNEINGTGPYKMTSFDVGQQMVLEANENYFGEDKAMIKKVIIKYFADPTTMSSAIESGQIDIAWRILGPVEATRLSDVEGLTVVTVNAPALRYIVFNCMEPAE